MTTNVEIAEFFSRFATAVTNGDLETITGTFAKAFVLSDMESVRFVSNPAHVQEHVHASVARYRDLGCNRIRLKMLGSNLYESDHAMIDLEWILLDHDSRELVRFNHSYVMRKFLGVWRIVFVIAHNEADRLQAAHIGN
jgi:hypothetical protein